MFFSYLLLVGGFFLILLFNVHYTFILLGLEVVLLGAVLFLCFDCLGVLSFMGIFLFFLVMVCLGGFSISLLVSLSRDFGRDYWFSGSVF